MAGTDCTRKEINIEQAKWVAREIVDLARIAKRLSIDMVQLAGTDESLCALINSSEVVAEKIGFLGDLCLTKLGDYAYEGSTEEWMLPPAYHEAATSKAVESA